MSRFLGWDEKWIRLIMVWWYFVVHFRYIQRDEKKDIFAYNEISLCSYIIPETYLQRQQQQTKMSFCSFLRNTLFFFLQDGSGNVLLYLTKEIPVFAESRYQASLPIFSPMTCVTRGSFQPIKERQRALIEACLLLTCSFPTWVPKYWGSVTVNYTSKFFHLEEARCLFLGFYSLYLYRLLSARMSSNSLMGVLNLKLMGKKSCLLNSSHPGKSREFPVTLKWLCTRLFSSP